MSASCCYTLKRILSAISRTCLFARLFVCRMLYTYMYVRAKERQRPETNQQSSVCIRAVNEWLFEYNLLTVTQCTSPDKPSCFDHFWGLFHVEIHVVSSSHLWTRRLWQVLWVDGHSILSSEWTSEQDQTCQPCPVQKHNKKNKRDHNSHGRCQFAHASTPRNTYLNGL